MTMLDDNYAPGNWYWFVAGDRSRAWSSATKSYVGANAIPQSVTPSTIANEVELYDVLTKAGCKTRAPSRRFSVAEVRTALLRIDAVVTGDANDSTSLAAVAEDIGFILPPLAS